VDWLAVCSARSRVDRVAGEVSLSIGRAKELCATAIGNGALPDRVHSSLSALGRAPSVIRQFEGNRLRVSIGEPGVVRVTLSVFSYRRRAAARSWCSWMEMRA